MFLSVIQAYLDVVRDQATLELSINNEQVLRRQLAQQALDSSVGPHTSGGAAMTWRTSTGGAPAGPMKATTREAIASARASSSTSTIQ